MRPQEAGTAGHHNALVQMHDPLSMIRIQPVRQVSNAATFKLIQGWQTTLAETVMAAVLPVRAAHTDDKSVQR